MWGYFYNAENSSVTILCLEYIAALLSFDVHSFQKFCCNFIQVFSLFVLWFFVICFRKLAYNYTLCKNAYYFALFWAFLNIQSRLHQIWKIWMVFSFSPLLFPYTLNTHKLNCLILFHRSNGLCFLCLCVGVFSPGYF